MLRRGSREGKGCVVVRGRRDGKRDGVGGKVLALRRAEMGNIYNSEMIPMKVSRAPRLTGQVVVLLSRKGMVGRYMAGMPESELELQLVVFQPTRTLTWGF